MPTIQRIVRNIQTADIAESQQFYAQLLGLTSAMDHGWVMTLVAPDDPTKQINLLAADPSGLFPSLSIEVADVDAVYQTAIAQGHPIVYRLTDEPWGVRRFFVRDPSGAIINIVSHRAS